MAFPYYFVIKYKIKQRAKAFKIQSCKSQGGKVETLPLTALLFHRDCPNIALKVKAVISISINR